MPFDPKQLQMFQAALQNQAHPQETEEERQLREQKAKMLQDAKLQALKQMLMNSNTTNQYDQEIPSTYILGGK